MNQDDKKVGNLKKIAIHLEAGIRPEAMDLTREPILYEFVYGVGSHGLSPFELELAERKEREEWLTPVRTSELANFFCHHLIPQLEIPESVGAFYLRTLILRVSAANPREIIKAMAEAAGCGSGCYGH